MARRGETARTSHLQSICRSAWLLLLLLPIATGSGCLRGQRANPDGIARRLLSNPFKRVAASKPTEMADRDPFETGSQPTRRQRPLSRPPHRPLVPRPPGPLIPRGTRLQPDPTTPPPVEPTDVPANPVRDPNAGLDIWQALQMAGGQSLLIKMAREQVELSSYKLDEAYALWLPSLRMGVGYARHDGELQFSSGDVVSTNRNSFFFGGGAGLGSLALPGGSGGLPRMTVNLSLAEVQFEPRIAHHQEAAAEANSIAVMNDVLLDVAIAYIDVLEARSQLVNARLAEQDAAALLELTIQFAENGAGATGDVDRARVVLAHQRIQVEDVRRMELVRTTTLARHLHLPASMPLEPRETEVAPMEIIPGGQDIKALVSQALARRPELRRTAALTMAEEQRLLEEQWRPWLPSIQLGASAGTFGGGPSSSFDGPAGRGDLEALAVWEWRNLGLVDYARQAQQRARIRQQQISTALIKDQVVAEVSAATTNVDSYQRQMQIALASLQSADNSYRRTLQRVRQAEGMPIEVLESIRARQQARNDYTRAISGFNRAQFHLLRAIGSPAANSSSTNH